MNELEQLISFAENRGATDIIVAEAQQAHFRINRKIIPCTEILIPSAYALLEQILEKFPQNIRDRYNKNIKDGHDVDCAFNSLSNTRIRANIFSSLSGLEFALRLIPKNRMTAEQIGLPTQAIDCIRQQSGLFLVTGISGSGKTTTLASLLDVINNTMQKHVLTIEDPIEYVFENKRSIFSQREIVTHANSYATALRSAVRENADIILIGEMRDYATVKAAIELAETGHMVMSTLHTRNSISTIDRILSMATTDEQQHMRSMISTQLVGVISQTLIQRTLGGLIASFEFLKVTPAVRNLIREDKLQLIYNELQTGMKDGMISMEDNLLRLVERDLISISDALRSTSKPEILKSLMRSSHSVNQLELEAFI